MRKLILILTIIFYIVIFITKNAISIQKIDSLFLELKSAKNDTSKINLFLEIGDMYEFNCFDTALFYYNQAKNLAQKNLSKNNKEFSYLYARSLSYIGLLYKRNGNYNLALSNLELSLKIFTLLYNSSDESKYKMALANVFHYIGITKQDMGNYNEAIFYLQKELKLRKDLNDKKGISSCYLNLGSVNTDMGNFNVSINYYKKSIEILSEIDDKFQMAIVYNNLSLIYKKYGDFVKALEYLQKSIKIYNTLISSNPNDKKWNEYKNYKAMNIFNLGNIHYSQKNYKLALKYYNEAFNIFKEISNLKGMAYSYNNLGNIYCDLEKYDTAMLFYTKSLAIKKVIGNLNGISASYRNIGYVYELLKNYEKALLYYNKSLSIKYSLNDKEGICMTLQDMASIYLKLKNPIRAIENAKKGLYIATELNLLESKNTAYKNLSEAWEKLQKPDSALKYYKLYTQTKDSIFNIAKNKQLYEIETKYQIEKKDQEILIQKTELAKKEANIRHKNNIRNILIICFIIVISFLILFYRYRLLLIKKNEDIKIRNALIDGEQKERSRLSHELHDIIGSQLNAVKIILNNCLKDNKFNKEIFFKGMIKLDETHLNIRKISRNIMPRVLEEIGLQEALIDLLDDYKNYSNLKINFQPINLQQRMTPHIEFNIYCIVHEIMQNVIKHSAASEVIITMKDNKKNIEIVIKDNGKGFDINQIKGKDGSGLRNIKSRVALLKGKISIESILNTGTNYTIQIPLYA